jgi:phosphoglycolate phosphatase-like HAD superfamily hydrolase
VGDSAIDWRTARGAGTRSCLVRWGFGADGVDPSALTPADRLIDTPADLLSLV